MKTGFSVNELEVLSAYLDGQGSSTERARIEQRLAVDVEYRDALEALAQTRALLRSAPRRRVPRNFTLTPAMVAPRRLPALFSFFRYTSFVSAAAVVLVLVITQALPAFSSMANTAVSQAAPMAAAAPMAPEAATEAPAGDATTLNGQPMIINWGNSPQNNRAVGMGGGGGGAPEPLSTNAQPAMGGAAASMPGAAVVEPTAEAGTEMGKTANIVESPPIQATATPEVAPSMDRAAPLIQDNGPILGVPSTQDQGKIVAAAPEIPTAETLPGQPEPPFSWWAVIGGLAALALASGGTAVWLRRRAGA